MKSNLVIVESPAKAKTIEKFLGKDFLVKSSNGHIRDLAKKDLGIDVKNKYQPKYIISPEKKKIVSELKKLAKQSETVWLASDEDREGEAIAWHLYDTLKLNDNQTKRIVFHEITKDAILNAIKNPRKIDQNLVAAQQARRILDRLVGFELSPVLWRKVKPALSAGRVQSVAVRLIVEREREILNFKPVSNFKITALFEIPTGTKSVELLADYEKKLKTEKEVEEFLSKCKSSEYKIIDIERKPSKRSPAAPFTTSTLQQEASRKLGFSVSQTMSIAQRLYESGKITYMRTDSVNLSNDALKAIKQQIVSEFGDKYHKQRAYKSKIKGAQEAHEAIRPSYMQNKQIEGTYQEKRLYELIWKRTIASQMSEAQIEKTNIFINASSCTGKFIASGERIKFDGFLKVYTESSDEENGNSAQKSLPELNLNAKLNMQKIDAVQRFSKSAPRYTEASLVKKLEELGIGRPSTYAPVISTIQKRGYVVKEDREGLERKFIQYTLSNNKIDKKEKIESFGKEKSKLFPTDIGMIVNDFLLKYFESIMDYNFTAKVEKEFDEISLGKLEWTKMIDEFYKAFHPKVEETLENSERGSGEKILGKDPETGKVVLARMGRYGALVQLGDAQNGDKPEFASLNKNQLIETMTLEDALDLLKNNKEGRYLGDDPETGKPVFVRVGRYGPMVQIGSSDDKEKPKYASLLAGMSVDTLELKDALKLFALPRTVGKFEDKVVVIGVGRFGPYVRHDGKFVSLKKTDDPLSITLERAIELIKDKREADKKKLIKEFSENPDIKIIKDRWGRPCIKFKTKYFRLDKNVEADKLSLDDCLKIINIETGAGKKKKTKK